ncbi:MAG: helix-turn-helix transcriptional regulator [Christensenellaceae bacterium]
MRVCAGTAGGKGGVSRQTIFKWAGLLSPSMENILALCRIFGVSADELIGNETPEEKTENEKAESIVQNPAPFDRLFHFEYKSKRTLWGLPLVHINVGMGFYRAKGIFAIGNLACGIVSVGCLSMGLLSFGALALGLLVLAGVGIGGLAVGGAAAGIFAVGGVAVGFVAIGGAAIGTCLRAGRQSLRGLLRRRVRGMRGRRWSFRAGCRAGIMPCSSPIFKG